MPSCRFEFLSGIISLQLETLPWAFLACEWQILSVFTYLKCLYFLLLLQDLLAGCRILGRQCLFPSPLTVSFRCLLAACICNANLALSQCVVAASCRWRCFPHLLFVFQQLEGDVLTGVFFVFVLLRICWASWMYVYNFSPSLGKIGSLFLQIFFYPICFRVLWVLLLHL